MRSPYVLAALASIGFVTAAPAQDAPATADQCLKIAFELAQSTEEKKLSDEDYKQFEDMLTTLEGQCDAQQFNEASASAKGIREKLEATP